MRSICHCILNFLGICPGVYIPRIVAEADVSLEFQHVFAQANKMKSHQKSGRHPLGPNKENVNVQECTGLLGSHDENTIT